jgi:hypothetical protein
VTDVNSLGKDEEKVILSEPGSITLAFGISYKPESPYLEADGPTLC